MAQYYYRDAEGNVAGPATRAQLYELRQTGSLQDDSPVCDGETETWVPLARLNLQPDSSSPILSYLRVAIAVLLLVGLVFLLDHSLKGFFTSPGQRHLELAVPPSSPPPSNPGPDNQPHRPRPDLSQ
jgi:hypothetical protein